MNTTDRAWWVKARKARDKLIEQVMGYPAVSLVDIGQDPEGSSPMPVLRVHVQVGDISDLKIAQNIDGIPIRVMRGDYQPQN